MIRHVYGLFFIAVFSLCAVNARADDAPAPEPGSISPPETAPDTPADDGIPDPAPVYMSRPENPVNADAEPRMPELLELRAELDSVRALIAFHGVKRYTYKVILKSDISFEPALIINKNSGSAGATPLGIASSNTRISLNTKWPASPYFGISMGAGFYGIHVAGSAGIERAFLYRGGFSVTPSIGAHAGVCGLLDGYVLTGGSSIAEFAFDHGRFTVYAIAGLRFSHAVGRWNDIFVLSLPLGAGLLLKI